MPKLSAEPPKVVEQAKTAESDRLLIQTTAYQYEIAMELLLQGVSVQTENLDTNRIFQYYTRVFIY